MYVRLRPDNIHEICSNTVQAKEIPLDDLANAVYQEPSEALEQAILNSMKYPIIVVQNTEEEHREAVRGLSNQNPYYPDKKYLVIIGNQRVTIASRNGFGSIHAFVVDTGREAVVVKKTYDIQEDTNA
tara:strand:- start:9712 stop:10095 length:384 start_codon:yes stop_codon:yes gene_type:complete